MAVTRTQIRVCPWCWGSFYWDDEPHDFEKCKVEHQGELENERLFLLGEITFDELKKLKGRNT